MTPVMRPFLPATLTFESRGSSPREFLEACLAELECWEPQIGAFVTLNLEGARDVSKLSGAARARLKQAEAMTLEDYRGLLETRAGARAAYAALASDIDATIALAAPGAAPVGLDSTGNPACTVHTSYLGIPSISLPLLCDQSLPLGLQVSGFEHGDAAAFAIAAWIEEQMLD